MHTAIPVTYAQFNEIATEALELKAYLNTAHSCFQARFHQRWHYFQIVDSIQSIENKKHFRVISFINDLKVEFSALNNTSLKILAIAQLNWNIPINALKYSSMSGKSLKDELLQQFKEGKIDYNSEFKLQYHANIDSTEIVNGVGHFFSLVADVDESADDFKDFEDDP